MLMIPAVLLLRHGAKTTVGRNGSAEWAASPPRRAEVQAAQRERRSSLVWFGLLGTVLRRRIIASVDAPCLDFRRRRGQSRKRRPGLLYCGRGPWWPFSN
jgi:hypothetical protein